MKKLLLSVVTLAALSGTQAIAADIPIKAARPMAAAPVAYIWTGCYIGAAGGGTWGRSRHVSDASNNGINITDDYDVSGGIAGVEYGCNWQSGQWVLGTESDFSWTNLRGGASNIPPFSTLSISNTREHWFSTTRVRVGLLADPRLLFYATGGLATARVEAFVDATAAGAGQASESRTRWGWTAGAGLEYALGGGWSAKADYLYARFNEREYLNPGPAGFAVRGNVPLEQHVVRVGINYKFTNCFFFLFGCNDAVVARY